MHSLLATNETDDLICVTEPWFSHIGVTRADDERDGRDVLGGAAHPNWDLHYPYFCGDQRAKVMVYARKFSRDRRRAHLPWRLVVRHDLGCHPSLLIVDVHDGPSLLRIISFYHDVDDESSMSSLLALDLDPTIPTVLLGDFNLHSPSWSNLGLSRSPRSTAFEAWAASQTFTLDTPTGTITRHGHEGKRPSTRTCGKEHRTNECTNKDKTFCVSCKLDSHASWNRDCPEFRRRCGQYDDNYLENSLPYFPTEEEWTLTPRPSRLQQEERFPARYAVATYQQPEPAYRAPMNKPHGKQRKQKGSKPPGNQYTMDCYIGPGQGNVQ